MLLWHGTQTINMLLLRLVGLSLWRHAQKQMPYGVKILRTQQIESTNYQPTKYHHVDKSVQTHQHNRSTVQNPNTSNHRIPKPFGLWSAFKSNLNYRLWLWVSNECPSKSKSPKRVRFRYFRHHFQTFFFFNFQKFIVAPRSDLTERDSFILSLSLSKLSTMPATDADFDLRVRSF